MIWDQVQTADFHPMSSEYNPYLYVPQHDPSTSCQPPLSLYTWGWTLWKCLIPSLMFTISHFLHFHLTFLIRSLCQTLKNRWWTLWVFTPKYFSPFSPNGRDSLSNHHSHLRKSCNRHFKVPLTYALPSRLNPAANNNKKHLTPKMWATSYSISLVQQLRKEKTRPQWKLLSQQHRGRFFLGP